MRLPVMTVRLPCNSNLITVWFEKGYTLRKMHGYEDSILCFDQALRHRPGIYLRPANKGYSLNELGDIPNR